MPRITIAVACGLLAAAPLAAQGGPGREPGGAPPGAVMGDTDPIGFLLEHRDSLRLADSQVTRLVQLNLRFFRRKRALELRLDSILPDRPLAQPGQQRLNPPGQDSASDQRARPVFDELRAVIRSAKDSAYALLTENQRERADSLRTRLMNRRRRLGRP